MAHHFGERGHRANFDPIPRLADATQFLHLAQIDHDLRPLDAIIEPVKAVQASGQHPGSRAVAGLERESVIDGRGLKEFERWYYVMNDSHVTFSSFLAVVPSARGLGLRFLAVHSWIR
jgi:hypothetical protein